MKHWLFLLNIYTPKSHETFCLVKLTISHDFGNHVEDE